MDYTQPLPPLVQYTGPVVDVKKMEPFSEDVATHGNRRSFFFSRLSIIIRANATPYFFDCSVVRIYAFLHPTPKSFEVYSMTFDTFGKFVDQFIGCKFPSNAHIISHRADLKMTSNILRVTPSSLKRQTSADQASS